jgi:hypothetical protein
MNTSVFLSENIDIVEHSENEIELGNIPDTNYPVVADAETLVTHHTAILGITGTGKSVFTRNLIKTISKDNTKTIVVDLTGEYQEKINGIVEIVSSTNATQIFDSISKIYGENAKFANQRDQFIITSNEETISNLLYKEIKAFVDSQNYIGLFNIPDITNSDNILEYTKYFFKILFKYAKENVSNNKICVVLEEAHTLVPEYNSMGVADNSSKATVNTIAQIALQGRKYNVGFIVVAQRTANVSKTVLTQCNSIISFQELDKTSNDFLSSYLGGEYLDALKNLKPRTAIAVGKAFKSVVPMIFEVPIINE